MGKLETLRTELEKARKELNDKGYHYIPGESEIMEIKPFEIKYQDVIEKIWPDDAWWQVTGYWDIFDAMLGGLSDEKVIDEIIKHVGKDYLNESNEPKYIHGAKVEYGHTMKEYLSKYGDKYNDGMLWDYLKEDFEDGYVDTKNITYWYLKDFNEDWRYFETDEVSEKLDESQELNEGTSNFPVRMPNGLPLLVFYTMDEFDYMLKHDSDYPQEEDFEDEDGNIDENAYLDAVDKFEQDFWDKNNVCVLDEDEQERLEEKLYEFNEESKSMAWDADIVDGEQQYGNNLTLEDVKLSIEPGYYSAAYIDISDSLDYLEDDFKEQQIKRFNDFFEALRKEFGLTKLGLAWGPASNGETGYKILNDSLNEKKSKKKYKVHYTGDPAKDCAFFNHAMGSDATGTGIEAEGTTLGECELKEGFVGQVVNDFLNIIAEPNLIETLVISDIDADDYHEAFKGVEEDLSEDLRDCDYADFDIGGDKLVINVSDDIDDGGDTYYTTVEELLDDYNGDEVEIQQEGEVLFSGDKSDIDEELLEKVFVYIDTPKYLCINAHCGGVDDEFEDDHMIFDNSQEAYDYLKELAQDEGYEFYDIVEDTYEYPNGLCLISYTDASQEEEIEHYCVEIRENLKEGLDAKTFYKHIQDICDEYMEALENEDDDVFGGTEDSYAFEMLQQHIWDEVEALTTDEERKTKLYNKLVNAISRNPKGFYEFISGKIEESLDNFCESFLKESFEEIYIKYWEDEELRDQGISEIYRDNFATREEAIETARKLVDRDGFASVEVFVSPSGELESEDDQLIWGYDGVETWGLDKKEESLKEEVDAIYELIRIAKDEKGKEVRRETIMKGTKEECAKEKKGLQDASPVDGHGNNNHFIVRKVK